MASSVIGKARIYPWEKWFKKKKFVLTKGFQYQCKTHGMAQQIRIQAGKRGLRVHIQIGETASGLEKIEVTRREEK